MNKADSNGTLVKADIVDLVYEKVGFTRQEAAQAVDFLFEEIKSRLAQGENVRISRFASFILRKKSLILTYFLILAMVVLVKMELYSHF